MRYRKIEGTDVSEIGLDCPAASRLPAEDFAAFVEKAIGKGINFVHAIEPEEATAVGEALKSLDARRKVAAACGIPEFFAAYARHQMPLEEFLEHELSDRLERLNSDYLDCFVVSLGYGRSTDLEAVLREDIPSGETLLAAPGSYEGGVFLHETISDCLRILERFKSEGRIRLAGLGGENVSVLGRVVVKHPDFDVVYAPYSYGFRAAETELIPIAAETGTAVVATSPLWWNIRGIPVTVLAESPYPAERAAIGADAAALTRAACKWPLAESAVTSVLVEVCDMHLLDVISQASAETVWTRADEEMLNAVADTVRAQDGLFLILSAMNSPDPDMRARGWAAYVKRRLPDFAFDPFGEESKRAATLETIASTLVQTRITEAPEDLDELL